jgi:hypothetical protein
LGFYYTNTQINLDPRIREDDRKIAFFLSILLFTFLILHLQRAQIYPPTHP